MRSRNGFISAIRDCSSSAPVTAVSTRHSSSIQDPGPDEAATEPSQVPVRAKMPGANTEPIQAELPIRDLIRQAYAEAAQEGVDGENVPVHRHAQSVTVTGHGCADAGAILDVLEDLPAGVYRVKGSILVNDRARTQELWNPGSRTECLCVDSSCLRRHRARHRCATELDRRRRKTRAGIVCSSSSANPSTKTSSERSWKVALHSGDRVRRTTPPTSACTAENNPAQLKAAEYRRIQLRARSNHLRRPRL